MGAMTLFWLMAIVITINYLPFQLNLKNGLILSQRVLVVVLFVLIAQMTVFPFLANHMGSLIAIIRSLFTKKNKLAGRSEKSPFYRQLFRNIRQMGKGHGATIEILKNDCLIASYPLTRKTHTLGREPFCDLYLQELEAPSSLTFSRTNYGYYEVMPPLPVRHGYKYAAEGPILFTEPVEIRIIQGEN